MHVGWVTVNTQ